MNNRFKKYRWFAVGLAVAVAAVGGAQQTGFIDLDVGGMASLSVVSSIPSPTNVAATYDVSVEGLKVTWSDTTTNETGFYLEARKPYRNSFGWESPGTWSRVGSLGPGVTRFNHVGVTDNSTYCYRVQAATAAGESPYSVVVCAGTRPLVATDLAVTVENGSWNGVAYKQHRVTWTDRSVVETKYRVSRGAMCGTSVSSSGYDLPTDATAYTFSVGTCSASFGRLCYHVYAFNGSVPAREDAEKCVGY